MDFSTMEKVLWAGSFAGHFTLLLVLFRKRLARRMPVFTGLIAYQALETIVLYILTRLGWEHAYFHTYWVMAGGDYCFQVAVILEIGREVLRPTGTWIRDARRSFLAWSGAGLVLGAGLSLALAPPGVTRLELWEMRTTIFTSLLTCEMFLAMLFVANRLGLRWRSHVMAVGQGLTAWGLTAILGDLAHVAMGWNRDFGVFDQARMWVYLGAVGFWTVSFAMPERQRAPISSEMQDYLVALHRRVQYDLESVNAYKKPSL